MTEQKQHTINVNQLSERAGVKPQILRRVLRAKFPRADKGKAYEWQQGDPQIEQILKAVNNNHKPTEPEKPQPEKPKAKNTVTKKVTKPVTPKSKKTAIKGATPTQPKAEPEPAKKELAAIGAGS